MYTLLQSDTGEEYLARSTDIESSACKAPADGDLPSGYVRLRTKKGDDTKMVPIRILKDTDYYQAKTKVQHGEVVEIKSTKSSETYQARTQVKRDEIVKIKSTKPPIKVGQKTV